MSHAPDYLHCILASYRCRCNCWQAQLDKAAASSVTQPLMPANDAGARHTTPTANPAAQKCRADCPQRTAHHILLASEGPHGAEDVRGHGMLYFLACLM